MRRGYIIKILKGKKNQWYWRLMHSNGRILAHSEMYSSKFQATKTARNLSFHLKDCHLDEK